MADTPREGVRGGCLYAVNLSMAMTDKTYLNQLETARTSILEGAQSATVGDFTFTYPTLSVLNTEINKVKTRLARVNGTRPYVTAVRVGGMGYS